MIYNNYYSLPMKLNSKNVSRGSGLIYINIYIFFIYNNLISCLSSTKMYFDFYNKKIILYYNKKEATAND